MKTDTTHNKLWFSLLWLNLWHTQCILMNKKMLIWHRATSIIVWLY